MVALPLRRQSSPEQLMPANSVLAANKPAILKWRSNRVICITTEPQKDALAKDVNQMGVALHRRGVEMTLETGDESRSPLSADR